MSRIPGDVCSACLLCSLCPKTRTRALCGLHAQPCSLEALLLAWRTQSWKMPSQVMGKNRNPQAGHMLPCRALAGIGHLMWAAVSPQSRCGCGACPAELHGRFLFTQHTCTHTHVHACACTHMHAHLKVLVLGPIR